MKRFPLNLPSDHPVWSLPRGERTTIVRRILDHALGFGVFVQENQSTGNESVMKSLEELTKKVDELSAQIAQLQVSDSRPIENEEQTGPDDDELLLGLVAAAGNFLS